jgi:hypothetical protein
MEQKVLLAANCGNANSVREGHKGLQLRNWKSTSDRIRRQNLDYCAKKIGSKKAAGKPSTIGVANFLQELGDQFISPTQM